MLRPEPRPNGVENAFGRLCFKSIHVPQDPVARLMAQYESKVISLWFNIVYSQSQQAIAYGQIIAEIGFGSINERRIAERPRTQFSLKSLLFIPQGMPPRWVALNPVPIRISSQLIAEGPCEISFVYEVWDTIFPKSL